MIATPPEPLLKRLNELGRRWRMVRLAEGLLRWLAALLAGALVIGLIDWISIASASARLAMLAGLGAALAILAVKWALPAWRGPGARGMASLLEGLFPQFEDRVRSAVDFLDGHVPGSPQMQQQVIAQSHELIQLADNRKVVPLSRLRPATRWLSAALVPLLVLALWTPQSLRTGFLRLAMPYGQAAWPRWVQLQLLDAVPTRLAGGQKLELRVRLARGDKPSRIVELLTRRGNLPPQRQRLVRGDDGVYPLRVEAPSDGGSIHLQLRSGDDQLQLSPIQVVPRLTLTALTLDVTPPPYAQMPASRMALDGGPLSVVEGSTLALRLSFNKPLAADHPPQLLVRDEQGQAAPLAVRWTKLENNQWLGTWTAAVAAAAQPTTQNAGGQAPASGSLASKASRLSLKATDIDGLVESPGGEYELTVLPDRLPTVRLESPAASEERTAEALVEVTGGAEDDFGLLEGQLVGRQVNPTTQPAATAPGQWMMPWLRQAQAVAPATWLAEEAEPLRRRFRARGTWDLRQWPGGDLRPGQMVEYWLRVRDNFLLNGKTHAAVDSAPHRLLIISQEELTDRTTEQMRGLARSAASLRNEQTRLRQETGQLAERLKNAMSEADRAALERLAGRQFAVASQVKQMGQRLEAIGRRLEENRSSQKALKELAGEVRDILNQAAEQPMKRAGEDLSAAPNQEPAKRSQQMQSAAAGQQRAEAMLNQAIDKLQSVGTLSRAMEQVRDLLKRQRELTAQTGELGKQTLGKSPEQLSESEKKALDELADRQHKLSEQTDATTEEMEKLSRQLKNSDPQSSEALAKAAKAARQQSVASSQSQAGKQMRANQQSQAQTNQQQAELGLETMLGELAAAQAHKLEELSRQLADLRQQVALLLRRQAGHTLDNVLLQPQAATRPITQEQMQQLPADAQRKMEDGPSAANRAALSAEQELTHRNTASLSKSAQEVDQAMETAITLAAAAQAMEQASGRLRQDDLVGALAPHQLAAWQALRQALEQVAAAQAKVDQELRRQQKDSIRQAYEKIRAEQKRVNDSTIQLDAAPPLADGSASRPTRLRMAQEGQVQEKLAGRMDELSEPLSAMGGVVYTWLNRHASDAMKKVAGELSGAQAGKPTQARQAAILAQLDALIDNLKIEPPPQTFEQGRQGGGGGGGGSGQKPPQLPAQVELQLLKQLQRLVNDATAAGPDDSSKDVLGQRQGELRTLLDQLLRKASEGKMGLPAEQSGPLPEEADAAEMERTDLENDLLNVSPTAEKIEKSADRLGDRMTRSRRRLSENHDAGKVTQLIQKRVLDGLDELIAMASKQQQQNSSSSSSSSGGQQQSKPTPGGDPNNAGQGTNPNPGHSGTPAANSNGGGGGNGAAGPLGGAIEQTMREWGGLSQRQRQAVLESAGENVLEKYRSLVEDYYRALAAQK